LLINKLKDVGYIYDPDNPKIIYKKEKELPKTWEEFCENNPIIKSNEYFVSTSSDIVRGDYLRVSQVRNKDIDANLLPSEEYAKAMLALCKLIQLRDCYNDGWKPDWKDPSTKYTIRILSGDIVVGAISSIQSPLVFKTSVLRNMFLSNFKDLIEQAKQLL